jgi:hypothetical protein
MSPRDVTGKIAVKKNKNRIQLTVFSPIHLSCHLPQKRQYWNIQIFYCTCCPNYWVSGQRGRWEDKGLWGKNCQLYSNLASFHCSFSSYLSCAHPDVRFIFRRYLTRIVQGLMLAASKRPNRVDIILPSPEDENTASDTLCFLIRSVIHHCHNPVVCILYLLFSMDMGAGLSSITPMHNNA